MTDGKRPIKLDEERVSPFESKKSGLQSIKSGFSRIFLPKSALHRPKIGLVQVFCVGFMAGIFIEIFKLHVAVRGQTFYDFVERKDASAKWKELTEQERRELLIKHGKEHLIEGLNL